MNELAVFLEYIVWGCVLVFLITTGLILIVSAFIERQNIFDNLIIGLFNEKICDKYKMQLQ